MAEAGNFVKWYVSEAVNGHVTIETNQIFMRNATWGRVLYGRRETGKREGNSTNYANKLELKGVRLK